MDNSVEHSGKSEDQKRSIRTFRDALKASIDFVRPQFQKGVRMYRLYSGVMPPEIESTFSQVMLWFAYAIVDQELTYAMRSMMTNPDWLNLIADEPQYERTASMAKKWLKYQIERKQQFQTRGISPIQSAYIFGNGYRWYRYAVIEKSKYVNQPNLGLMGILDPTNPYTTIEEKRKIGCIVGSNLNYFNGFPSPSGYEINTPDELSDERLEYFIAMFFPTKDWIQREADNGNFDKEEVKKLFDRHKSGSEAGEDPAAEFKEAILEETGKWKSFSAPEWVKTLGRESDNNDLNPRYRCGIMFQHNRWRIVAEDAFLLYDGPALLNMTPVANFKCSVSGENFHGIGIIEPVEDLILSMIMNFDMRLDHLISKFHPTKYIPQALVDDVGGDLSRFDQKPDNMIPYQHTRFQNGIGQFIYNESGEELSNQAFLEQGQMKEYLEDIISQKSSSAYSNTTATVGGQMFSQDVARSMLRAMNIDMTGIRDCAEITLRFGAKYINEDEMVRTGAAGIPWESIDFTAITDGYGVEITGARNLIQADEMFKKQLTIAPLLLNDPQIRGQVEMKRQLLTGAQFNNIDSIMNGSEGPASPMEAMIGAPKENRMPGGIPSFQNDARSSMNRNTVDRSGSMVAAGAAGV